MSGVSVGIITVRDKLSLNIRGSRYTTPTLAALLDVAHDLVAQRIFDADVVLTLLSKLPGDDFDAQIRGAVRHAQITAEAARDRSTAHTAVVRFAWRGS